MRDVKYLVTSSEFAHNNGIKASVIGVYKYHGKPFIYRIKNRLYVDEKMYIKRKKLQSKVVDLSQKRYYKMRDYFRSESAMANYLSSETNRTWTTWLNFLSNDLFSNAGIELSIFSYKITDMMREFYKISGKFLKEKNEL